MAAKVPPDSSAKSMGSAAELKPATSGTIHRRPTPDASIERSKALGYFRNSATFFLVTRSTPV
jgi:hypothetical protein